ncbi:Hypothetical predicted protein [Podarcis lilfordi]|uniref:Uncharacterized protein n=1 Tax=Podarcis lilfordi TaxID=74358 RepID=A0AA35JRP8_9SAUR|nr:Hypothetical predicted protein [Podarcis lilfordi]
MVSATGVSEDALLRGTIRLLLPSSSWIGSFPSTEGIPRNTHQHPGKIKKEGEKKSAELMRRYLASVVG